MAGSAKEESHEGLDVQVVSILVLLHRIFSIVPSFWKEEECHSGLSQGGGFERFSS